MRRIKKSSILIFSLLLIINILIGCDKIGGGKSEEVSKEQNKKIGMVLSTLNESYFINIKLGAEKQAKEFGYDLTVLDSQDNPERERANVRELIEKGIGVLIINPTGSNSVGNSIKMANEKDIPVVTIDRRANEGNVACHITSDNVEGGKMAAEYILETLGGNVRIVEIQGTPGASATVDRWDGFHRVVDKREEVEVVASESANFNRQRAFKLMKNIIQTTPDFNAVFAHNDEMAIGAVQALGESNKKALVVGFDGDKDALKTIESGSMAATIAQQPDLIGILSVENAIKVSKGSEVEKEILVELKLIRKDNLE